MTLELRRMSVAKLVVSDSTNVALLWLALSALLIGGAHADCYARDGTLARNSRWYTGPELVSCGNGTNNCCLEDQKCASNLLCVNIGGQGISRQYCADENWTGCSEVCPGGGPEAGFAMGDCGGNVFCCSDTTDCCEDGTGYYVDPDTGEATAASLTVGSGQSPTYWTVDSAALLSPTSSAESSTDSTSTPTPSSSAESTGSFISTMTSSGASANSSSTSGPAVENKSSSKLSAGAGAGIGIGCAAVLVGVIALIWYILRQRRKKRQLQEPVVSPAPQYSEHGGYMASSNHGQISSYNDSVAYSPQVPQYGQSPGELASGEKHVARHEMS